MGKHPGSIGPPATLFSDSPGKTPKVTRQLLNKLPTPYIWVICRVVESIYLMISVQLQPEAEAYYYRTCSNTCTSTHDYLIIVGF